MEKLLAQLNILFLKLRQTVSTNNSSTPQGETIFKTALASLGTDASPSDVAPDELGCAETVSDILIKAGFLMPVIVSTAKLYEYFLKQTSWLRIDTPIMGDVIISPTGMGGNNGITNGHVGIVGKGSVVMSNSSATGTFEPNYTLASWTSRYKNKGGYPIYFFRKII